MAENVIENQPEATTKPGAGIENHNKSADPEREISNEHTIGSKSDKVNKEMNLKHQTDHVKIASSTETDTITVTQSNSGCDKSSGVQCSSNEFQDKLDEKVVTAEYEKSDKTFSSSDQEETFELTLDTLPTEIFLHICSFLHAKFVIRTLSLVCQSFHATIIDNVFWKVRLLKRWPKRFPPIAVRETDFNWMEACIEREEQHRLWSHYENNMIFYRFSEGLFAPVDAVHIMKDTNLLAVGSRDRYLNVLDMNKLDPMNPQNTKETKIISHMDAHKGWIWSFSSLDHLLASGGWDACVKFWDIADGGREIRKIKAKSAILCSHFEPDILVAGGYDKRVYHIDPRSPSMMAEHSYHKRAVLCMGVNNNYIITGSEDKTIVVYDRRADKIYKRMELEQFPMCMSYDGNQLWWGDKKGQIHLIDASDGDFDLLATYDVGHKGKVTGIVHTLGAIYTCSSADTIRVSEPSLNPDVIAQLPQDKCMGVARIDYKDDVLVSGNGDISVGIWKPNTLQQEY